MTGGDSDGSDVTCSMTERMRVESVSLCIAVKQQVSFCKIIPAVPSAQNNGMSLLRGVTDGSDYGHRVFSEKIVQNIPESQP